MDQQTNKKSWNEWRAGSEDRIGQLERIFRDHKNRPKTKKELTNGLDQDFNDNLSNYSEDDSGWSCPDDAQEDTVTGFGTTDSYYNEGQSLLGYSPPAQYGMRETVTRTKDRAINKTERDYTGSYWSWILCGAERCC